VSHQIASRACSLVKRFNKVLILQPTRDLIDKTAKEEIQSLPEPPAVRIFHKGSVSGKVAKALSEYAKGVPDDIQEVVFAIRRDPRQVPGFASWIDLQDSLSSFS
jgi:hypothetical protein